MHVIPHSKETCKACIYCIIQLFCAGNLKHLGRNSLKEKCPGKSPLCNLNSDLSGCHTVTFPQTSTTNLALCTRWLKSHISSKTRLGIIYLPWKRIPKLNCILKFLNWPTIEAKYWPYGEFAMSWECSYLIIWSTSLLAKHKLWAQRSWLVTCGKSDQTVKWLLLVSKSATQP